MSAVTLAAPRPEQLWAAGDFSAIGHDLVIVGESLCEALELRAAERVLDVATGTGSTALAAARRRCEVVGSDFVEGLLERAAIRAAAEGLTVQWKHADAQALPWPDAHFDAVSSTFGVMFATDAARAAAELARVCRPGGRIGLACWTPDGFAGLLLETLGKFTGAPPRHGDACGAPADQWGRADALATLLGHERFALRCARRTVLRRYRSIDDCIEEHRRGLGPLLRAFESLSPTRREELAQALAALVRRFDRAADGTVLLPCDYLETIAIRR